MEETQVIAPRPESWPRVKVGGVEERYTLRYSFASDYMLATWGKNLASAYDLELAASMAGNFDAKGRWKSAAFASPVEFIDMIEEDEFRPIMDATAAAVKNRYPSLEVKAIRTTGSEPAPALTIAAKDSSDSGASPQVPQGSESLSPVSGA